MKLQYKARTKSGELQVGFIEAPTREAAVNTLSSHDLFILSLQSSEKKTWYEGLFGFLERVSGKDLMIFTRQFATLLSAKIPLSESLRTLEKQTKNPILKNTIFEIISDIDAGLSLSQSLEKYNNIFSPFYVSLIRSAEITGRMEEAANYLADYMEKEVAISGKIKNAMIYPAVIILLFLIVVGVMAGVVLPQIEPIFKEAGVNIPIYTNAILVFGKFIAAWWWAVVLVLLGSFVLVVDYFKTLEGKGVIDEIVLRMPIFGRILKQLYVARFAESVSILIKGGIPISQTLEISSVTVGSTVYKDILRQVAEDIRRGELLSQSLSKNEEFFPPLVSQMIAIGESTGRLEELLGRISSFYTREVDSLLGNLVELIQPALMLVIGILVAGLFASILIPIYNLAQSF